MWPGQKNHIQVNVGELGAKNQQFAESGTRFFKGNRKNYDLNMKKIACGALLILCL